MNEPEITASPIAFEMVNLMQVMSEKKSKRVKKASKQSSRKILNLVTTSFFSSLFPSAEEALTAKTSKLRMRTADWTVKSL